VKAQAQQSFLVTGCRLCPALYPSLPLGCIFKWVVSPRNGAIHLVAREAFIRTYYVFQSTSSPQLRGFTEGPKGDTLPAEDGLWTLVGQFGPDEEWPLGIRRAIVAIGIAENGFIFGAHQPARSLPSHAAIMIRQARELGYQGQIVKTGGPGWQEIVAGAGKEAAEGTIGILYANPNNENYRRISAEYKKSIGQDPNDMLLPIYDGFNVLLHAIQKAGAVDDTTKVAAAFAQALPMKSIQSEELTLGGKANWGSNQQIMTVNYIGIIKSGVPQVVGSVK
jgi:hypothetical protein